ncbi:MAG: hypothetical protein ACKPJD_25460, partial [Planctomycetaceae bacterium]
VVRDRIGGKYPVLFPSPSVEQRRQLGLVQHCQRQNQTFRLSSAANPGFLKPNYWLFAAHFAQCSKQHSPSAIGSIFITGVFSPEGVV